uniref:PDZ domain-containing protein n=1 Tax=Meloidogyne floridensis TaxID=298350 RepID=A0A915NGT8_9BILA
MTMEDLSPTNSHLSRTTFRDAENSFTKASTFHSNLPSPEWFETLENEFDKAFVDLDVLIGEVEQENQSELIFECRRRLTLISGVFAKFAQKVQVICQQNYDFKKDLQNSNNKLIGVLATNSLLEEQSEQLLLRVHSLSCQLYSKTAPHESEIIKKKLDKEMRMFNTKNLPITKSQAEISLLKEENLKLKSLLNSVHSEIYGARLAAKYLDKELAGRIQQIQLLGRNMRASPSVYFDKRGVGKTRRIHLHLEDNEGLGISITGGKEHGVPIIISELHSGQAAESSGNLFVGDAILSVNGKSLNNLKHSQAVKILNNEMRECNEILLEVILIKPDFDSDDGLDDITQTLRQDFNESDQIPDDNFKSNKRHKLTTSYSPSPSSSNFCEKKSQQSKSKFQQSSCSVSSISCDSSTYESASGECTSDVKLNQTGFLIEELKVNDKNMSLSDNYNDAFV